MRVFISHSSKDMPAVEALDRALRERGIETWLDQWTIAPGDDIVARINAGLEEANAGLIVFSSHSRESRWVEAEVSYLTYARIQEGKVLIPVVAGDDAYVPPLLRPLARRGIEEVEAIADALKSRRAVPPHVTSPVAGRYERVVVSLRRNGVAGVEVRVGVGGEEYGRAVHAELPRDVAAARDAFLRGFRAGLRRGPAEAAQASLEIELAHLGRVLRDFCLPGSSAEALAGLVDGCGVGTVVEVCFEADDPELLGLPFEALRLPDDRLLATLPPVVTVRRPAGVAAQEWAPLAGPIKVLAAVGAPDEGNTRSAVLDYEQEFQNILDAVEEAQRHENVQVRILEVCHPDVIAQAIERDPYHVLHLSCHGGPGVLELEDEDGRAVPVTASQLVDALRRAGRPLPLVFLSACHGGVEKEQTASFAESLLRAGVPAVLAMQTAVTDHYATRLARTFYEHLARREPPFAGRALAEARKELEHERMQRVQHGGAPLHEIQPEYATAALYVAGQEAPLADFALDKVPLRERPVYEVSGPVPQLRIDDLIGRRKELRETLRTLRDPERRYAGVVLTGIGGVGKSAVAGRVMQRLKEGGWYVAAHRGRFDLRGIAVAVGTALIEADRAELRKRANVLTSDDLDERVCFQLLCKTLAEDSVLLVLDDFEQNLPVGGGTYLNADVGFFLETLASSALRGRLLITCRYPVPNAEAWLREIAVGPLSDAETRKLVQRLPGLRRSAPAEITRALRAIGGHPRILEFLDALLHSGEGRLSHVTRKLNALLGEERIDLTAAPAALDDRLQQAVLLGMRDVLLEELVALSHETGDDEALFQAAVSNLPTSPEGLAHMLAGGPPDEARIRSTQAALVRLADRSLVVRFPDDSAWVHRWTAEGLARISDPAVRAERCNAAGRYRVWRVKHDPHDLGEAIEAVRNFLAGRDFDAAAPTAKSCLAALRRFQQSVGIAALAGEVLESLPPDHPDYAAVADKEAQAHLVLGFTERARQRYEELLGAHQARADAEPDRADYQRYLSVSYERMGDLYRALGQGDKMRETYLKALAIREHLAQVEPDHAGDQRDLAVSYGKVGDIYRALGQGDNAREAYLKALDIRERLAQAEPDRAEYQRDLAFSYDNVGDLHRTRRQDDKSREAYLKALDIRERLAQAEPDRAEYQRDLSLSYNKVGDIYRALGQGDNAREAYLKALDIRERLAQAEPDRADYQRDLSVSYNKLGDLYRTLGQGDKAREAYFKTLDIRKRLTQVEPYRADYQRDLSISYERMGDLYRALGQDDKAREVYVNALQIRERLAAAEPGRADYQVDLSLTLARVGGIAGSRELLERALAILQTLHREGRLSPQDEPKIAAVEELLRDLE
ncbi:MAG TPA: tetratricopeptide repeat protein [Thermoanaerobaculia bacterium]|nr:tetratricopeptide repeat protein [Thermoanaerobaculia bacterium]